MHHSLNTLTSAAKEPIKGDGRGDLISHAMKGLQESLLTLYKKLLSKTEAEERERERERKAKLLLGRGEREGEGEGDGDGVIGTVRETFISSFGSFVSYYSKAAELMALFVKGIF